MGWRQKLLRDLIYFLIKFIYLITQFIPLKVNLWIGSFAGTLCFYILRTERSRSINHLTLVYGNEKTKREIKAMARENFRRIGYNVMENVCMKRILPRLKNNISVTGVEYVKEALKKGKGLIWVTGHLGNWEIMPIYFSRVLNYPVSVIAAPLYDERLTEFITQWRGNFGVQTIVRGGISSYKLILEAFKKNKILGMLIDQDTKVQGVFVDFLGMKAFTPSGAVELALKFNAPIVVGFCRRTGELKHEIRILDYTILPGKDTQDTILKNTQLLTRMIEEEVRSRPEDWVWMHRRWKRKPQN